MPDVHKGTATSGVLPSCTPPSIPVFGCQKITHTITAQLGPKVCSACPQLMTLHTWIKGQSMQLHETQRNCMPLQKMQSWRQSTCNRYAWTPIGERDGMGRRGHMQRRGTADAATGLQHHRLTQASDIICAQQHALAHAVIVRLLSHKTYVRVTGVIACVSP